MIKSPYSLNELDQLAKLFYKDINHELRLKSALRDWLNAPPANTALLQPVVLHLYTNIEEIIIDQPASLELKIQRIEDLIAIACAQKRAVSPPPLNRNGAHLVGIAVDKYFDKWARNEIKRLFDYEYSSNSFIQKNEGSVAYRHAKRMKMSSCPYCNSNFTFTIKTKRGKSRPQFDHFLKKGRYPYFGLSFFNLIPACSICNSAGIKGQKLFSCSTHLHPFIDDMEGSFYFRTKVKAVDFLVNSEDFNLLLRPCKGTTEQGRKKAAASIIDFALNDRYKFHKEYAGEVIQKAVVYNDLALGNLFRTFKKDGHSIFNSESEIKELVMGNYMHPDRFHKRILSKLTTDIAEEFGLTL